MRGGPPLFVLAIHQGLVRQARRRNTDELARITTHIF